MATPSTNHGFVISSFSSDEPRDLANLPTEILHILFQILFEGATIFCRCHKFEVDTKKHMTRGSWSILLASQRLHREGLPVWYEMVTMDIEDFYPSHYPGGKVENCHTVKLGRYTGAGHVSSTNLQRYYISRFLKLKVIKLPLSEAISNSPAPSDQEILALEPRPTDHSQNYSEWAQNLVSEDCFRNITVKYRKVIRLRNLRTKHLICDIVVTRGKTMIARKMVEWEPIKGAPDLLD